MRIPHALLLACATAALPRAVAGQGIDRRAAVAPDVSVRVWLPAGSLRLVGWDRDSIVVTGAVAAGETFFFDGDRRAMKLGIEEPSAGRVSQPSHITAYIPRRGRVSVLTSSASISASDLSGTFSSVTGAILLTGAASDVQADAVDGDLEVNMTAPSVRARTGGGDLSVGGSVAELYASTVSGDLGVTAGQIVEARLESTTGSVTFAGDFAKGGTLEAHNHAGLIDIRLAGGLQVNLEVTSVAGTITNTLSEARPTKGVTKLGEVLAMPAGLGWPRIVVRSFKGEVLIRNR